MFFRILKKDMQVRKSVNLILFLFITIASVFLSSSVSNIVVVTNAIDYFMDYANTPDVMMIATKEDEKEAIKQWVEKEAPKVDNYRYEQLLSVTVQNIKGMKNTKELDFVAEGADLYLSAQGMEYCKVYDMDGNSFELKSGEVAIGKNLMENNKLKLGDKIIVRIGNVEKELTIKLNIKDAVFGHEMSGMQRMILNEADIKALEQDKDAKIMGIHCVDTKDINAVVQACNDRDFETVSLTHTESNYKLMYTFDLIVAALLILIGICLIFIALLVLRFALVFTIEEDYREIGIMKAIGMRNFDIKKIYMIKYFFLVILGSVLGMFISIPVSMQMIDSVSQNMIMENDGSKVWINVLCTIFIIIFVLLFCYRCTKKLNKISTIAAIRGGQTGERYGKRIGLSLYRRNRMPVNLFLGLNDILRHLRRYGILLFTFCISFILITIPLNTLNTMRSREMVNKFCVNPDSSTYVRKIENAGEDFQTSKEVLKRMEQLKEELEKEGYKNVKMTVPPIFFMRYYEQNDDSKISVMTLQILGDNTDYLEYEEGEAPKLENEIAFSKDMMETYGWKIGDCVETVINDERVKLIITGTYSDYMQMGMSARLNSKLNCKDEPMFDYWNIMIDVDTDKTQEELTKEMEKKFPDYEWSTAQQIIDNNVGGIQDTLDMMLLPMTGMLCALIMLITILMERLFIVREKGEIAMLKSIGYRNKDIRIWQTMRMIWVALLSMVLAIPLSLVSNNFVLKPIFKIMGAEVDIQVVPWQVYGVYPAILLAGIVLAAIFATRSIRKIHIQEMNGAE